MTRFFAEAGSISRPASCGPTRLCRSTMTLVSRLSPPIGLSYLRCYAGKTRESFHSFSLLTNKAGVMRGYLIHRFRVVHGSLQTHVYVHHTDRRCCWNTGNMHPTYSLRDSGSDRTAHSSMKGSLDLCLATDHNFCLLAKPRNWSLLESSSIELREGKRTLRLYCG
jgi:hypothetical protein